MNQLDILNNPNAVTFKLHNIGYGTAILRDGVSIPSGKEMSLEELKISKSELVNIMSGSAMKFFVGTPKPRIIIKAVENSVIVKETVEVKPEVKPVIADADVSKIKNEVKLPVTDTGVSSKKNNGNGNKKSKIKQ